MGIPPHGFIREKGKMGIPPHGFIREMGRWVYLLTDI